MGYLDSFSKPMMDMIATEQGQIFEYKNPKQNPSNIHLSITYSSFHTHKHNLNVYIT